MSNAEKAAKEADEVTADADGVTVDADGATTVSGGRPCPRCETPMYHRHCKYVCPEHGVVYDCSDTFY